jgi:CpXC protein
MARSADVTYTCACGNTFTTTLYQVVNVTLEPRLLYRLLAGNLNVATCPNCGRRAESAQPFIYHDMGRGLFAYVTGRSDVSADEREELLVQLRQVYSYAVEESDRIVQRRARDAGKNGGANMPLPTVRRSRPYDDLQAKIEPDAPPMQIIFGADQLITLVDSLLEPEEKLARVALTARNTTSAEQERITRIASTMAEQMSCDIAIDDEPDTYTVWIYGPRNRIDVISQALKRPV